jgi:methylenetetrahydrofolate dehydrogenase (NADP+)/methenyltetrahydrofolate cyclohydrolase
MQLLEGNKVSEQIIAEIAEYTQRCKSAGNRVPHLAAILVGDDGASKTYVAAKVRACERAGMDSTLIEFPRDITEVKLLQTIHELNARNDIDGYIVQLPLPKHIDEARVIEAIHPDKDVDGFHPQNLGKMMLSQESFIPATPKGIIELLRRYHIDTVGKHCVVLGRSHIVGLPVAILMQRNMNLGNATVTIVHSKSKDVEEICRRADILIVATGRPEMVTAHMVKPGAVIVDVGITRIADESKKSGFRLAGDVNFSEVSPLCSFITPVPGGVGPMTIAALLQNTMQAHERRGGSK